MLWANMALHTVHQTHRRSWHAGVALVAPDGFLMFSCLGPDTLRELRTLFAAMGWPAPSHEFTDMHDWGDMLVRAGFAEPVMDMQRITLTFTSPQRLLQELRTLGRNLHPARFGSLRGRAWLARLHMAMDSGLRQTTPGGPLQLTFEIIYGHAFKPMPRMVVQPCTTISLDAMRHALRSDNGLFVVAVARGFGIRLGLEPAVRIPPKARTRGDGRLQFRPTEFWYFLPSCRPIERPRFGSD